MTEILERQSVVVGGNATTRDAAITEAGNLLLAAGAVTQAYVDSMLEREQSVSTYMGNFLAIPHGTNEAKDEIVRSALSVIRYAEPIDWSGQPVKFVIGIAGKNDEHLEILGKIAMIFSDEAQVTRLEQAADADALLAELSGLAD